MGHDSSPPCNFVQVLCCTSRQLVGVIVVALAMPTFSGLALAVAGLTIPTSAFFLPPAAWSQRAAAQAGLSREGWTKTDSSNAAACALRCHRKRAARGEGLAMKKEPAGEKGAGGIDPRRQALDGVLHQIERCYGRGSILKLGDTSSMNVETSPTGASLSVLCQVESSSLSQASALCL